jgi:hypothetical protein
MKKLSAFLALLFLAISSCGAWPRMPTSTLPIPPELQALFVEAEGEFPLKTLHGMPQPLLIGIYWVDNHRLIYTVRKLGDWEARDDERSKIIIYDVDTGKIEETPYRGNLWCLGTDGQILIQDYALPDVAHVQPGDTRDDTQYFLSGTLGQPLTRFKRPKEHGMLDSFSCQFYASYDNNFGRNHYLRRLRPVDGVLDVANYSAADSKVRLLDPDGKERWSIDTDKFCNRFGSPIYLPWAKRYFVASAFGNIVPGCPNANKNSWLFSPSGIETKPLPKLVEEARKYPNGLAQDGMTYWARPGMFVLIQLSAGVLDGLYWVDEKAGKLKRVLKKPRGLDYLSPNGCRNFVLANLPLVIELCKGEEQ